MTVILRISLVDVATDWSITVSYPLHSSVFMYFLVEKSTGCWNELNFRSSPEFCHTHLIIRMAYYRPFEREFLKFSSKLASVPQKQATVRGILGYRLAYLKHLESTAILGHPMRSDIDKATSVNIFAFYRELIIVLKAVGIF